MKIEKLWGDYLQSRNIRSRNSLVTEYLGLVSFVAEKVYSRLPQEVRLDDLESAGVDGLMDAIGKYNPKRDVKFETYAYIRINGSILDYLREIDLVPRGVRNIQKKIDKVQMEMLNELGRNPTVQELAKRCGVSLSNMEGRLRRSKAIDNMISLYDTQPDDSNLPRVTYIKDNKAVDPFEISSRRETIELLVDNPEFNEKEKEVLRLHYCEGLCWREVGERFNISESMACRIAIKGLKKIKGQLCEKDFY